MAAKLGILAGAGELPAQLVEICRQDGREVFVLAFEGHTDSATVAAVEHAWVRLGAVAKAVDLLRRAGVRELVMIGAIARPSLAELRPDFRAAQLLAKAGARALGDDGLLRAVIEWLEGEGFQVIGIDEIMGHLLAVAKTYGRLEPDPAACADIDRGIAVALALGAQDVGQAVVVQQGIVLGVEAIEGTDALLGRCAGLRRGGPGGVLVKVKKPNQEHRVDLPTIGPRTVEAAAAAGLRGIAVEAGGALVVEADAVAKAADDAGLFVIGALVAP
jgi:DUF1009 family protein